MAVLMNWWFVRSVVQSYTVSSSSSMARFDFQLLCRSLLSVNMTPRRTYTVVLNTDYLYWNIVLNQKTLLNISTLNVQIFTSFLISASDEHPCIHVQQRYSVFRLHEIADQQLTIAEVLYAFRICGSPGSCNSLRSSLAGQIHAQQA